MITLRKFLDTLWLWLFKDGQNRDWDGEQS